MGIDELGLESMSDTASSISLAEMKAAAIRLVEKYCVMVLPDLEENGSLRYLIYRTFEHFILLHCSTKAKAAKGDNLICDQVGYQ